MMDQKVPSGNAAFGLNLDFSFICRRRCLPNTHVVTTFEGLVLVTVVSNPYNLFTVIHQVNSCLLSLFLTNFLWSPKHVKCNISRYVGLIWNSSVVYVYRKLRTLESVEAIGLKTVMRFLFTDRESKNDSCILALLASLAPFTSSIRLFSGGKPEGVTRKIPFDFK